MTCTLAAEPNTVTSATGGLELVFAPAACHVFDSEGHRVVDAEAASIAGSTVPTLLQVHQS